MYVGATCFNLLPDDSKFFGLKYSSVHLLTKLYFEWISKISLLLKFLLIAMDMIRLYMIHMNAGNYFVPPNRIWSTNKYQIEFMCVAVLRKARNLTYHTSECH